MKYKQFFKDKIAFPLFLYIIWRFLLIIFQIYFQDKVVISTHRTIYEKLITSWSTYWDGVYFSQISQSGYSYPLQTFFPLNPLINKISSINPLVTFQESTIIVSSLFGLASFIVFYNLANLKVNNNHAKTALLIFCVFPTTIFLNANYSESYFLFFTLLSFIFLEKKFYFLSALSAGVATSARLVAIGIAFSIMFIKTKINIKAFLIAISLSGVVAYMLYLYINFNNPLLFLEAQKNWCTDLNPCKLTFPLYTPIHYLINYDQLIPYPTKFLDWIATLIFLILTVKVHKKFGIIYSSYTLFVICLWLTNGKIVSMARYLLAAFPVFFILPEILKTKTNILITCIILLIIQLIYVSLFTNYLFVA